MIARLVLLLLALASPAYAASTVVTEHARSTLFAETDGVAPGGVVTLVFRQELQEGWHVYWKNPGDSGLPLDFQWTLPEGAKAGPVLYPPPERIPVGPLANFGHHGLPVFLVDIVAPAGLSVGSAFDVALKATWLICEEICVPEEGAFTLSLPVDAEPQPNETARAFAAAARTALPQRLDGAHRLSTTRNGLQLELKWDRGPVDDAFFFPDAEGLIEPAARQTASLSADGVLSLGLTAGETPAPSGTVSGVLVANGDAFEIVAQSEGAAAAAADIPPPTGGGSTTAILPLLLSAFVGGALLNLMPCVFPILFIKAAALAGLSGAHRNEATRHGVLYALGVVATFLALGAALLALRAGGEAVGWGFHLQSPLVVGLSALVLFMVGLNFAGVYSVGEGLQGVGSGVAARGGGLGAFMTGVLAVFVAAPCVGPFLTAPVGAAAVLPGPQALGVFALMGAGLAAPFLALSLSPALARFLPRPGPWMRTLREALAFPVFAGAAFFVWVMARLAGESGLAATLAALLLAAAGAWLYEQTKHGAAAPLRRGLAAAFLLGAVASIAVVRPAVAGAAATVTRYGGLEATPYSRERLQALAASGSGVFVDFTAAWCVTCQANKITVLSRPALAEAFARRGVTLMTADWTRRDPEITALLAEFGANGVPLYVFYPANGAPRVLPQPLTLNAILDAVSPEER